MASNTKVMQDYFLRITEGLIQDATQKGQKIPVSSFRFEVDDNSGVMYAADYFKYLIYGRGPGKQPPPHNMLAWVQANPQALDRARAVFRNITEKGLAYLIGRKIGREGTDIYSGKKAGIDLLGVMEQNMPELLKELTKNEVTKIATDLKSALK